MITSIELKNFQRHKHLKLDLNHPITTIIGESDHGKSAILRALRWVSLNQPSGCEFMNWDAKEVSVKVSVDGHEIQRSSTGTTNLYVLDGKEYRAFGREVPEDIKNVLGMSALNFQWQHDAPFWLSLSPAEVSRQLNQIVNLELIDKVMSKLDSLLRNARAVAADRQDRLTTARNEYKQLRFVAQLSAEFEQLERLSKESEEKNSKANDLDKNISWAKTAKERISQLRKAAQDASMVLAIGQNLAAQNKRVAALSGLLAQATALASTAQLQRPDTGQLRKLATLANNKASQYRGLRALVAQVEDITTEVEEAKCRLTDVRSKLRTLTNGRCPLCNQKLAL